MGLDLKLSYNHSTIINGNGRIAFDFVKRWVKSKEENLYGKDILLTEPDIDYLINEAIKDNVGEDKEYSDTESFLRSCVTCQCDEDIYTPEGLVQKLLLIRAIKDFEHYYLECDW